MATYRCNACLGIYLSPQQGVLYFHTCSEEITDFDKGTRRVRPNHRDENIEQTLPGPDSPRIEPGNIIVLGTVKMRARGAGAVKLSDDDLLSGADAARLVQLRQMAGVPVRDV